MKCHRDPKPGRLCSWEKLRYVQQANPELTTANDTESPLEYVNVPLAWYLLTVKIRRARWPVETESKADAAAC